MNHPAKPARRKSSEAEIWTHNRYQSLFENDLTGDFVAGPDGKIRLCNAAFARIFGFASPAAARGKNLARLQAAPDVWPSLIRLLKRHQRVDRYECSARHRDGTPLHIVQTLVGVFDKRGKLARIMGYVFDDTERKLAEEAVRHLTADLERRVEERTAQLRAEIAKRRQLERQILEISEREQRRLGQDLHDGLGQCLATARFQLGALHLRLAKQKLPDARRAARIERALQGALEDARQIARGLLPVHPDSESLMAALQELADSVTKSFQIPCRLECRGRVLIHDHPVATNLFRIAQEAVNNAARHARPKHIRIALGQVKECVHLSVEDDGCGLPAARKRSRGLGLGIMQYRASAIGATFAIGPRRGRGTVMTCDWKPSSKESHAR